MLALPLHRLASSGDLLADRRFAYGEALAMEGDHAGAADLFEQALELAPDFAPAWLALGTARRSAGLETADEAFSRALALDPEDRLGAGLYLGSGETARMTPAYVGALFDGYAPRFEAHLTGALRYDGPQKLHDAVAKLCERAGFPSRFERLLDLGCGTGLVGARFADVVDTLEGCDLSPAMLAIARSKGLYHRLDVLDAETFLATGDGTADLIVAADVLPYIGDLHPLTAAAARRLAPTGLLALSLQSRAGAGFELGADLRYAHSQAYLEAALAAAALVICSCEPLPVRHENGAPIPGLIVVAAHG